MDSRRAIYAIAAAVVALTIVAVTVHDVRADAQVGFGFSGTNPPWWRGIHTWQFPDTDPSGPPGDDDPLPNPIRRWATGPVVANVPVPVGTPIINIVTRLSQGRGGTRPVAENPFKCHECDVNPNTLECADQVTTGVGLVGQNTAGPYSPATYAIANGIGSPWAGPKLGTSAAPDSAFAEDSMRVQVTRSDSVITLSNFRGFLRNRPTANPTHRRRVSSQFFVAVYPDSFLANRDVENTGVNAVWRGRVVVDQKGGLSLSGEFGGADFTLTTPGGDQLVVPNLSMIKTVTFHPSKGEGNGSTAEVRIAVDPRVDLDVPLPGASPAGILALSAAMAGAGLWVMKRRRRLA